MLVPVISFCFVRFFFLHDVPKIDACEWGNIDSSSIFPSTRFICSTIGLIKFYMSGMSLEASNSPCTLISNNR
jgi:hypothetical protein